ncbi:hypothetical protein D7X33_14875 [Butyricicoccus sp. 1XD8-22]|nr:hypothetical protein D7X33_14875 [Butyricicoccus sp. 1XD8-22]
MNDKTKHELGMENFDADKSWDEMLKNSNPEIQARLDDWKRQIEYFANQKEVVTVMNPAKMKIISWTMSELNRILLEEDVDFEIEGKVESLTHTDYGIHVKINAYMEISEKNMQIFKKIISLCDGFSIDQAIDNNPRMNLIYDDAFLRTD